MLKVAITYSVWSLSPVASYVSIIDDYAEDGRPGVV